MPVYKTLDANEATAHVAFRINEVIAIYPITPSSPMGEWADAWMNTGQKNIFGTVPAVIEMQSEGGAAGTVHGALQAGSLTTTFTASQGLLLMIPNMYKIAGELTPTVFHVAARTVATHALSIFADHSDVMAVRQAGWGMLASNSVQEAHDFALLSTIASLRSRVPFVHFFDGFRTSHEIAKIEIIPDEVIAQLMNFDLVAEHRARAMTPDRPVLRGTAQNPDVFFQGREACNPYYDACPGIVQQVMDEFAALTGRQYSNYETVGAADAERVIVLMGSGAETTHETVDALNAAGEKVAVNKVRLYRPFDTEAFLASLPETTKSLCVLDRTKEPGASGEPLYLDVVQGLFEAGRTDIAVTRGRYGLSSKEYTPAMIKAIYDNMAAETPKKRFTVGIEDDVTHLSLAYDPSFSTESDEVVRALFYGLGSDGTVGANKNTITIIGENTDNNAQGYFVYDSKKSGATTVSHLRFGPETIRSAYLIERANFVACHQFSFIERFDMLDALETGGTFLLNTYHGPDEIWDHLPQSVQQSLIDKQAQFYVIDAYAVARESGMGGRINTVMQTCFFAISQILPREEAIEQIKDAVRKTYGKKGDRIVQMNLDAIDDTLANLHAVQVPETVSSGLEMANLIPESAPEFYQTVLGRMVMREGDLLPVSAIPVDGTFPTGTTQYEKRNLAQEIPVWDPDVCIQCGKCAFVCPHAVIRIKAYDEAVLEGAPETFKSSDSRDRDWKKDGLKYTIQVAPEDCTACGICVDICPAKDKSNVGRKAINMEPQPPIREQEAANWDFFLNIPEMDRRTLNKNSIRQQQVERPLFEFSGACAGCGETPYVKLASQLFGDRMIVANATGCSSIYGGNLPTTPWATDDAGRGPTWSNSLFEDNAEFGLGMRLAVNKQTEQAQELLQALSSEVGEALVTALLENPQKDEADIHEQRENVAALKERLRELDRSEARQLLRLADNLVKRSIWIMGGDGWAYDIGFGGLDHVLSGGHNVNVLVLDTEVYSNTGGQASKATPRGAVAKFAAGGRPAAKKDMGLMMMTYGNIYVASVAMGAKDEHTLRVFLEAEAYDGPSIIFAYSTCIAHGINMATSMQNQKAAVDSAQWLLYRYNPDRALAGENPLQLDSRPPKKPVSDFMKLENRFKMLHKSNPEAAKILAEQAQVDADTRFAAYEYMAARPYGPQQEGANA